jgi:hypothetical protein
MRRILLLLLAVGITSQVFSQEKAVEPKRVLEDKYTVGLGLTSSDPALFGVLLEIKKQSKVFKLNSSDVFEIAIGATGVTIGNTEITGGGFVFRSSTRYFLKKESWKGFYLQSGFEGGTIKFSNVNYSGSYKYLSLFNPDLGFKWQVSKRFSIDPAIGFMWKIEIKGSGDVDNTSFDNVVPKIGLKIGYSF